MKVAQLLGLWGLWWHKVCRDMDCFQHRSYGPIKVFFQTSCSWRSEGLFGQSFSVALPIRALGGLPCLGSFSVVQHIRHIEGPPWLGPYSVDQCIREVKGSLGGVLLCSSLCQVFGEPASLLLSCQYWRVEGREAMVMAPPPMHDSAVLPCFHGWPTFLHRHFPPRFPSSRPSIRLSAVNSSLHPGIAPQSPNSSSQPPVPSRICMAAARTV